MGESSLRGRRALITGASSGLGADFARELASRGCNVTVVARREDRLQALREEIQQRHNVEVDIVVMDLTEPGAPQALYDRVRADGHTVDVLINNAGYGLYGAFADIVWDQTQNMLELDVMALTHLTKLFVQDMLTRNVGYILLVSSVGAYQPTPTYAVYSAAKSYVLFFGEALHHELAKTNISCTVMSPGIVATEFLKVSGQKASMYQRLMMMQSAEVATIGIDAMLQRRSSVIPGRLNALMAWGNRFMPRSWSAVIAHRLMTLR